MASSDRNPHMRPASDAGEVNATGSPMLLLFASSLRFIRNTMPRMPRLPFWANATS